jgi:Na+/H+ antiporter NhaD/arsenite permease-like protein
VTGQVVVVFTLVYLGMLLGRLPRLQLDRTGVALLGAIALVASGAVPLEQAVAAVDVPTIALLFALMVVSAQLRLGGFYTWLTLALAALPLTPAGLLLALVLAAGLLSAVFTNDVVCLAVASVAIEVCRRRGLDPLPFLLALACASNVGSAATLIGNPQNVLIGQTLELSFTGYLADAVLPAVVGLLALWAVIVAISRRRWLAAAPAGPPPELRPFDRWQTAKGLVVAGALLLAFLFTTWPREIVALVGAAALMTSRRLHSRDMLGLVDWQLLVLFGGLFVVTDAFERTGVPARLLAALAEQGVALSEPGWLFAASVVLSNLVSNVPAVMLLLSAATHPLAGATLALSSTLAGNLLLVGSVANLIVVEVAARSGIAIDWRQHARVGIPVTFVTLGLAVAWLAVRAAAWAGAALAQPP